MTDAEGEAVPHLRHTHTWPLTQSMEQTEKVHFFLSEYTRDWAGARLVSNIEIEQPIFTIKDTDYFYTILDP